MISLACDFRSLVLAHPHPGTIPPQLPNDHSKPVALNRESDCSPRNGPIYYVSLANLDHAEKHEIKTAGRRLADFQKTRLWSTGAGQT